MNIYIYTYRTWLALFLAGENLAPFYESKFPNYRSSMGSGYIHVYIRTFIHTNGLVSEFVLFVSYNPKSCGRWVNSFSLAHCIFHKENWVVSQTPPPSDALFRRMLPKRIASRTIELKHIQPDSSDDMSWCEFLVGTEKKTRVKFGKVM